MQGKQGASRLVTRRVFVSYAATALAAASLPLLGACSFPGTAERDFRGSAGVGAEPEPSVADVISPERVARIAVLGDTHVAPDFDAAIAHTRAALAAIRKLDSPPDAIVINGDVVNHGLAEEYDLMEALAAEAGLSFPGDFILGMGDHEQWGLISQGYAADFPGRRDLFLQRAGRDRLYYDACIGGEHLVVLGPDADPAQWSTLRYSDEQLSWLEGVLAADAAAGARTFVFTHAPADDTVAYTFEGEQKHGSLESSGEFRAIVDRYPHAIVVSSHTHSVPDFQRPDPAGPLFVASSAVAYRRPDAQTEWSDAGLAYSQGLLVDAYVDRVEFLSWDFMGEMDGLSAEYTWEG